MKQKLRVFIAAENRLVRESLSRILLRQNDFEVIPSQGTCSDLRQQASRSGAEILILDSANRLFSGSGVEKFQGCSGLPAKILLVCMEEDERLLLRAIRAGVLGFIAKDASALEVVAAVRSLARGEAVCPVRLRKFLFDFVATHAVFPSGPSIKVRPGLTRRERQLIPLIGRGLTNKEIAGQLNLSEQTIKKHVHRILNKVGADGRMGILGVAGVAEFVQFNLARGA